MAHAPRRIEARKAEQQRKKSGLGRSADVPGSSSFSPRPPTITPLSEHSRSDVSDRRRPGLSWPTRSSTRSNPAGVSVAIISEFRQAEFGSLDQEFRR